MHQTTTTTLEQRIKRFIIGLKKNHGAEIAENPSVFRSRVIGKVKAGLPRKRPGRKGTPEVKKAAEIYDRDFKSRGKDGNWDSIAKHVFSDYENLTPELQKLRRLGLRANVHSFLYDERSRLKRKAVRVENIES